MKIYFSVLRVKTHQFSFSSEGWEKFMFCEGLLLYAVVVVIWHLQDSIQMYTINLHFLSNKLALFLCFLLIALQLDIRLNTRVRNDTVHFTNKRNSRKKILFLLFVLCSSWLYFFQFWKSQGELSFINQSGIMATFSASQMSEHVIFHYVYIKLVYHLFPFTTSKMFLLLYLKINFLLIHLI